MLRLAPTVADRNRCTKISMELQTQEKRNMFSETLPPPKSTTAEQTGRVRFRNRIDEKVIFFKIFEIFQKGSGQYPSFVVNVVSSRRTQLFCNKKITHEKNFGPIMAPIVDFDHSVRENVMFS